MKSPPILTSDAETEAIVEQSREEARSIVRHHLENHSRNNPGRSSDYVSWIATLHPENADVVIDQRFFIPGNPWWTIYEQCKNDFPSAVAVPVEDIETVPTERESNFSKPHAICLCNPIETFVALLVILTTLLVVVVCEIVALSLYLVAFIFYWIAKLFDPPNPFTGIFYSFFMVLYHVFMLCDSVCLLSSVCVSESCALVCWPVSLLLGGIWAANQRHQYIRRNCHLIRWAFRAHFSEPPRHFCSFLSSESQDGTSAHETVTAMVRNQTVTEIKEATVVVDGEVQAMPLNSSKCRT